MRSKTQLVKNVCTCVMMPSYYSMSAPHLLWQQYISFVVENDSKFYHLESFMHLLTYYYAKNKTKNFLSIWRRLRIEKWRSMPSNCDAVCANCIKFQWVRQKCGDTCESEPGAVRRVASESWMWNCLLGTNDSFDSITMQRLHHGDKCFWFGNSTLALATRAWKWRFALYMPWKFVRLCVNTRNSHGIV